MDTPFPWGSHPLGNPVFRHDETSRAQRRCLTHHLHEASLAPILPARVPRTATLSQVQGGSGFKRSARGRVLASSVIEVRAIMLSPYCAELASLRLQRFGLVLAFTVGCCPLSLSELGEPVFLEYPSNSSRLYRRSHRAYHGARSQHMSLERTSRAPDVHGGEQQDAVRGLCGVDPTGYQAGGKDNISAVVLSFQQGAPKPSAICSDE